MGRSGGICPSATPSIHARAIGPQPAAMITAIVRLDENANRCRSHLAQLLAPTGPVTRELKLLAGICLGPQWSHKGHGATEPHISAWPRALTARAFALSPYGDPLAEVKDKNFRFCPWYSALRLAG